MNTERRTGRQVWRENAKLTSREGSRGLGTGEESRDDVGPREIANALLGMLFARGESGTGRGCGWVVAEVDARSGVSVLG